MGRIARSCGLAWLALSVIFSAARAAPSVAPLLDPVSHEQAQLEKEKLKADQPRSFTPAMAEYRQTAQEVKYKSGPYELPGFLYRPKREGRLPAVIWNHGS